MKEHDPTDLLGQAKDAKDRTDAIILEQKQLATDVKKMLGTDSGRRILWKLLADAGVFRLSFNPTAMQMAFNEGRKSIGLEWLGLVNQVCPENYLKMLEESKQK